LHGAIWIASYLLLAVMVAALTFAVFGLYGLLRTADRAPIRIAWPFERLAPGDAIPWISQPMHRDDRREAFFVVVGDDDADFALCLSAQVVAERWGHELEFVGAAPRRPAWLLSMKHDTAWRHLTPAELRAAAPASPGTIGFSRDGHLLEAAMGLATPSEVAGHFHFAAAPMPTGAPPSAVSVR